MVKSIGSTCSGFKAWRYAQVTSGDGGSLFGFWGGKEAQHAQSLLLG